MSLRYKAAVLAVSAVSFISVPIASAAAATSHTSRAAATNAAPATSFNNIAVTGKAQNGKPFTGHLTVTQFVTRAGRTMAVGTLTGKIGNRSVKQTQVMLPTSLGQASTSMRSDATTQAASCPILNLVLGPLHLNLLGLHVDLNQVVLNITAVPGAGNLLGNLLCGVANLLNNNPVTGSTLTGLLNIVEQLANTPALSSL